MTGTAHSVEFPSSLPGLAPLRFFTLSAVQDAVGLYSLDSLELPEVKIFLLDPGIHMTDYAPDFEGQLDVIGNPAPENLLVLVIVNTSDSQPHANLLAPVVIHTQTSQGAQIILDSQDLPMRAPLLSPAAV